MPQAAALPEKTRPPISVIAVIVALALLVPLYHMAEISGRNWSYGASEAASLDGPYFWAVVIFRTLGALILAGLLWRVRSPTAIWVTIVACWLSGPPITFLLSGIFLLSASLAANSVPENWRFLGYSCVFPFLVTICLLAPNTVRRHYGLTIGRS